MTTINWGNLVFCKKCGYENDDDALYCENCGTNLSSINSPSSSGRRKTNKILMVAVVVLILGISVIAGMMMISKAPVVNNTNVTNENQNTQSATQNTSNNGPEIIDSNSITGNSEIYRNFKFELKTYKNTEYNLVIYSTFSNEVQNNLKQTGTLSMNEPGSVLITVDPKASGRSNWASTTSQQGYSTIEDFYWGYFRNQYLMKGPIH